MAYSFGKIPNDFSATNVFSGASVSQKSTFSEITISAIQNLPVGTASNIIYIDPVTGIISRDVPVGGGSTGPTGPTGAPGAGGVTGGVNWADYLYWDSVNGVWAVGDANVIIGSGAGQSNQGFQSVAIGNNAANFSQGINSVAVGLSAGQTVQGDYCVAIGSKSGRTNQQTSGVAIGKNAASFFQNAEGVAIGSYAGNTNQGFESIAIGTNAAAYSQGAQSVAIGPYAGDTQQGTGSVAIGTNAGAILQQNSAIAIGNGAGNASQGLYAIAIGSQTGYASQGANSIIIGSYSGQTNFPAGAILINATGSEIGTAATNAGFHVTPVRNPAPTTNALYYNNTTKEITYGTSSATTKNTILPLKEDTRAVYGLQPRSFLYNSDPASGTHIGYIAEEAAVIHERFAGYNEPGGAPVGIDYNCIMVFVVEELRALVEEVHKLKETIAILRAL